MKKLIFITLVLLLISGCSSQENVEPDSSQDLEISAPKTDVSNIEDSSSLNVGMVILNMAEVSKHNSRDSCYTIIDNKVYDLTEWISQHPGGAGNILKICGIDGTSAFEGQHNNNPKQVNQLEEFFIGDLVN